MQTTQTCPECGAIWSGGDSCQEYFHQMLFWENERPDYGAEVHHLMVLCYHLQHPSLYSPEGLEYAQGLLKDFLLSGTSPAQVHRWNRGKVASDRRLWKVRGSPGAAGAYGKPMRWTMTASDVVAGGLEDYPQSVRRWAASILAVIQAA